MRGVLLLLLASILPLRAADSKIIISLFGEAEKAGDSFTTEVQLTNPPKTITVSKVPIVTEADIAAIYPFTAPDGALGAYFQLDTSGRNRLEQFTVESRGRIAVVMVNGRIASAMMVDKKITDGLLYLAAGLQPMEIVQLEARYPTIGSEKDFKEQKKKAESLIKEAEKNAAEAKKEAKKKNKGTQ